IVRGDSRDHDTMSECIKNVDAIFPLACFTGAPLCAKDRLGARQVIVDAVKMLLELRRKEQVIIYPTTNSGYGIGQDGIYCTEETPLNPVSIYGKLKVEAEELILASGNSIALRLATAFGVSPRMRLDLLVNDFTYRAVTDLYIVLYEAHFKRNFIHIRDITRAFIHCLENFDTMKNEVFNVGMDDANLTKMELCEEIKKQVRDFYFVEAAIGEDPDKRNYIVSNAKIAATGFKPDVSIQTGITELLKGYKIIRRNQFSNV
ncbi:NAD-dependent epimerase/dehydratase family protein, partial [Chloroflexota bacterium]